MPNHIHLIINIEDDNFEKNYHVNDKKVRKGSCKGCIRPGDVTVYPKGAQAPNAIEGRVMVSTFLGQHNQLNVMTDVGEFVVSTDQTQVFPVGETVMLSLAANKIILID